MNNGDGIALGWSGHAAFLAGDALHLFCSADAGILRNFPRALS
jgi:hypothetical protein